MDKRKVSNSLLLPFWPIILAWRRLLIFEMYDLSTFNNKAICVGDIPILIS